MKIKLTVLFLFAFSLSAFAHSENKVEITSHQKKQESDTLKKEKKSFKFPMIRLEKKRIEK